MPVLTVVKPVILPETALDIIKEEQGQTSSISMKSTMAMRALKPPIM